MLKLTLVFTLLVLLAMVGTELLVDVMEIGYVIQENDARLAAAYSVDGIK